MTFLLILPESLKLRIFEGGKLHIDKQASSNNNDNNEKSPVSHFLLSIKPKRQLTAVIVNDKANVAS